MAGIFLPKRGLWQKPPVSSIFNPNCPLARGLQAFYPFSEGGGSSCVEASGQNPAATLTGGTGAAWGVQGLFGPSLQLTSTIGYVNAGNICDNLSTFTVSVWFKTNASPGNACIVGKFGTGGFSSGPGWGVFQIAGQFAVIVQVAGGVVFHQLNTNANFNNNKWHHAVFTVSGYAVQNIYIDGAQVAATSSGTGSVVTTTNTANLTMGQDNSTDFYNGSLDAVGIWNRVLTVDEIERLYTDPFCLITSGAKNLLNKGFVGKAVIPVGTINASVAVAGVGRALTNASGTISAAVSVSGITSLIAAAKGTIAAAVALIAVGVTAGAAGLALLQRSWGWKKPPPGAFFNSSPLVQGLAAAFLMNEEGGTVTHELLSNQSCNLAFSPTYPAGFGFQPGLFGSTIHFAGQNAGRVSVSERPAFTDLGLTGPMSVAFWYNYDAAQLALAEGSSIMGKSDSTDGGQGPGSGFTHGWNINSDNWHLVNGVPTTTGPQVLKLEFECGTYNKQAGIFAPTVAGVWHHIVITTAGGASTPTVNDYTIYADGVQKPTDFFVPGTGDPTVSDAGYNLAIGSHTNGSNPFNGFLDVVLLYNRQLSSAEAQQLYINPFCFINIPKRKILTNFFSSSGRQIYHYTFGAKRSRVFTSAAPV